MSRADRAFLRRLFELEVPEIHSGAVEIKSIAREAGMRSKVAVAARQANVDPVGSCVGMKGQRIQKIVDELGGEKIDVVLWDPDMSVYIANALSPAQVLSVDLDEEDKTASVVVPEKMLSLAIGKEGQNARLAAKLTGWRIDIRSAYTPPPRKKRKRLTTKSWLAGPLRMLRAEAATQVSTNGVEHAAVEEEPSRKSVARCAPITLSSTRAQPMARCLSRCPARACACASQTANWKSAPTRVACWQSTRSRKRSRR